MWPLAAILIGGFIGINIWKKQQKTKTISKESANIESFQNTDKQDIFSEKHSSLTTKRGELYVSSKY